MKKRLFFTTIFCLFIIVSIPAIISCQKQTETPDQSSGISKSKETLEPAYGDLLVTASIADAKNLIGLLTTDNASHQIVSLVNDGLLDYDENLNIKANLAESWEVSDDNLTITFHLRRGVKWHDGVEFTSADVLFGYQTMVNPNIPTAYSGDFEMIEEATAPDPYTFVVKYKEPFAPGLYSWVGSLPILPRHLLEGKDLMTSELGHKPVGVGPFKFKEWKPQHQITLVANEDYWDGRPYMNGYIIRIIPDMSTIFLEVEAGNVDLAGQQPDQFIQFQQNPKLKKNFNTYKYYSFFYTYLGYNLKNPMFQDKRVRQGLSYAINKQEIVDGVLRGFGKICIGPYKPGTAWENLNVNRYAYNPEKARALLAEAGWKDTDGDGILDKNGKPFHFIIATNQGNKLRQDTAEIIQQRLKDIGIDVDIRIMEWSTFVYEFINKRTFEAVLLGWSTTPEPDQYDIWHSSKTAPEELNFVSYNNPEMDRLLVEGRRTFDREKRIQIYHRICEILAEDQPYTFLYVPESLVTISSRFYGITPAPAGLTYNLPKWYVPKHMQKYALMP